MAKYILFFGAQLTGCVVVPEANQTSAVPKTDHQTIISIISLTALLYVTVLEDWVSGNGYR